MKINKATKNNIEIAATRILNGGIVAFPTETVYGLGALASHKKAIDRVFSVKGRPKNNPLIVHVHSIQQALSLVRINNNIIPIMKNFWPGPLTLVMNYNLSSSIHKIARANLNTIAIRIPSNPIAVELLKKIKVPIIAPSANTSEHLSPTSAKHVNHDLGKKLKDSIDMILDGGNCKIGIESTVIDITKKQPVVLRPGGLNIKKIEKYLKNIESIRMENNSKPISPGQFKKHYSPKSFLRLNAKSPLKNEAWLGFGPDSKNLDCKFKMNLSKKSDLDEAAMNLFSMLRTLDKKMVETIAVKTIPNEGIGLAINDRLIRGANK
tara:strand:- start:4172 stop:5137 length:966 start_codon:yes stop_codon:yes gene_type:complete